MKNPRPVILLEFNELSPLLMTQFMKEGRLPNFKKLHAMSDIFLTDAGEAQEDLEPWIQWVTVHSGLSYSQHGISRLGEGQALNSPRIWNLVSQAGMNSLVFGSMNQGDSNKVKGVVLPDPWATDVAPKPAELKPFFSFVQDQVQNHTQARPLGLNRPTLEFLWFMLTHGLSFRTLFMIAIQLIQERFQKNTRWKRVALLDRLQFDLFRKYFHSLHPHFSSFFLNSTAHLQHLYWRNLFPDSFDIKPTAEEQAHYADAILFGYQSMDNLLGEFLKLSDQATLVFATALSQQACTRYESIGGKTFNRPITFESLMEFAKVPHPYSCAPVMAEEFYVYFESEEEARQAEERLSALRVNGRKVLECDVRGASVFCGCKIFDLIPEDALLTVEGEASQSGRFYDYFYVVKDKKSGMHHPQGMLWVQRDDRRQQVRPGHLPLTKVFPMLLSYMGLEHHEPAETLQTPSKDKTAPSLAVH